VGLHVEFVAARPGMAGRTIVLRTGFLASYAMTGWRLRLVPEWLNKPMTRLMVNSNSCTASFNGWLGVAALEGSRLR